MILGFLMALAGAAAIVYGVITYSNKTPEYGGTFSAIHNSQPWQFTDEAKDLNLLYIGYAKCPDVCPMALSFSAQAFQQLSEKQQKKTRLVFLSVDVEHDTPENVAVYAHQFNSKFIGLTGTKEQIDGIVSLFKASYIVEEDPKSYLGYSIAHTDRIFFLNKKGIVVDSLPNPRSADDIVTKIKEHL